MLRLALLPVLVELPDGLGRLDPDWGAVLVRAATVLPRAVAADGVVRLVALGEGVLRAVVGAAPWLAGWRLGVPVEGLAPAPAVRLVVGALVAAGDRAAPAVLADWRVEGVGAAWEGRVADGWAWGPLCLGVGAGAVAVGAAVLLVVAAAVLVVVGAEAWRGAGWLVG